MKKQTRKNKLLFLSGILFVVFGSILLISYFRGNDTVEFVVEYQPVSMVNETNIRKIIVSDVSENKDRVKRAFAQGFTYNEEDGRMELESGKGGELTFTQDIHDIFSLRIKYKLFDDRIPPAQEEIIISQYENGILKNQEKKQLNEFVDGDWVYLWIPQYIKIFFVILLLILCVCAGGVVWWLWKLVQIKRTSEDTGTILAAGSGKHRLVEFYAIAAFVVTSVLLIIRAHCAGFTWDESRSYLVYMRYLRVESFDNIVTVFSGSMANNHLLNTILGSIAVRLTDLTYDEMIIRIPNVIMGIAYGAICLFIFMKQKITVVTFSLLIWNYYLNEFFSLARGYGLACGFVLCGLVFYEEYILSEGNKQELLTTAIFFFTLACSANTVTLLLEAAMIVTVFIYMVHFKKVVAYLKEQWMFLIPLGIGNMFLLMYHLYVSENDFALYAGKNSLFPPAAMITSFINSYVLTEYANYLMFAAGAFIIASMWISVRKKPWKDSVWLLPMFVLMAFVIICEWILHKGFPYGRALVPFYPLFIISIAEAGRIVVKYFMDIGKSKNVKVQQGMNRILKVAFVCMLVLAFVRCIRLDSVSEWYDNADYKRIAYDAMVNPCTDYEEIVKMHHPMPFYREQIREKYHFDIYEGKYE